MKKNHPYKQAPDGNMDTAIEVVLFAIGVLCAVSFVVCTMGACIGQDTNWQESFSRSERVGYVAADDMWYPGVRLARRHNLVGWWNWVRGRELIQTPNGTRHWLSSENVMDLDNVFRPKKLSNVFPRRRRETNLEDGTAPLVGNFMRAYTPVWSFVINNVIIALSTAVGFETRLSTTVDPLVGFFVIFGVTFISGFLIMLVFFYLFGFGEAMLAPRRPKVLSPLLVRQLFDGRVKLDRGEAMVISETNTIYGPRLNFNYVSKIYVEPPSGPATLD